jgi:hypothetical protein
MITTPKSEDPLFPMPLDYSGALSAPAYLPSWRDGAGKRRGFEDGLSLGRDAVPFRAVIVTALAVSAPIWCNTHVRYDEPWHPHGAASCDCVAALGDFSSAILQLLILNSPSPEPLRSHSCLP